MTYTAEYRELLAETGVGTVPASFRAEMSQVVGPGGIVVEPSQLRTYECDGLTGYRVTPALVVLPESTEEVAAAVRLCGRAE